MRWFVSVYAGWFFILPFIFSLSPHALLQLRVLPIMLAMFSGVIVYVSRRLLPISTGSTFDFGKGVGLTYRLAVSLLMVLSGFALVAPFVGRLFPFSKLAWFCMTALGCLAILFSVTAADFRVVDTRLDVFRATFGDINEYK